MKKAPTSQWYAFVRDWDGWRPISRGHEDQSEAEEEAEWLADHYPDESYGVSLVLMNWSRVRRIPANARRAMERQEALDMPVKRARRNIADLRANGEHAEADELEARWGSSIRLLAERER